MLFYDQKDLNQNTKYTQEFVNTFEPDFNFNDTPVNRYNISTNNSAKNILIKAEKLAELKKKLIQLKIVISKIIQKTLF